jgi:hypothetical protein
MRPLPLHHPTLYHPPLYHPSLYYPPLHHQLLFTTSTLDQLANLGRLKKKRKKRQLKRQKKMKKKKCLFTVIYGCLSPFIFMRAQDFITPLFPLLHKVRGAVRYAFKGQLMLVNGSF